MRNKHYSNNVREELRNLHELNERNDLLYRKKFISKEEYLQNLQIILNRIRNVNTEPKSKQYARACETPIIAEVMKPDFKDDRYFIYLEKIMYSLN